MFSSKGIPNTQLNVIYMLVLLSLWLVHETMALSSSIILTTDSTFTLFNGTTNPNFTLKEGSYDCSAFLYNYAQTSTNYKSNTPLTLTLTNMGSPIVAISTYYKHFSPSLGQLTCSGQKCTISIYHNCPSNLNSHNYFDIIQLNVQNLGNFYYFLSCNKSYTPFYFEWGQLIITICATVILIISAITARLEAFGGSGIIFKIQLILIAAAATFVIGMLAIYAPIVAGPLVDVISWLVGIVAVGIVVLDGLYPFFRHRFISKGCHLGKIPIRYIDVISLVCGLAMLMTWWFTDKNWIVSDLVSVCIIWSIVKVFKYTSLKVAIFAYVLFLCLQIVGFVLSVVKHQQNSQIFFLYTLNSPFEFQMPVITPTYGVNCTWISTTSIFLPGLLVAFLHRFDKSRATNIYLISSIVAYFVGSIIWNIISSFSKAAIPFDAVCPPFVFLTISFMAFNRKELRTIWDGNFHDEEFVNKKELQKLGRKLEIELPQVDLLKGSIPDELYLSKENIDQNIRSNLLPSNSNRSDAN